MLARGVTGDGRSRGSWQWCRGGRGRGRSNGHHYGTNGFRNNNTNAHYRDNKHKAKGEKYSDDDDTPFSALPSPERIRRTELFMAKLLHSYETLYVEEMDAYCRGEFVLNGAKDPNTPEFREDLDPIANMDKEGSHTIELITNFFEVNSNHMPIYKFTIVNMRPNAPWAQMPTKSLQSVLASSSPNLGYFFIDESKQVLYTLKRLANLKTPGMLEEANWFVNFVPAGIIQPEEPTYSIFFKHVVQALFRQLDLHKIDGFHFSPSLATNITKDCESWPGFRGQFGIHQYEQRMLCVDLAPATFTRCYPKKMQQQHLCPVDEGSVTPKDRLAKILMLLVQLEGESFNKVQERLDNSGLDIYQRLVECGGRVLPRPALIHNTKTAGELNINLEKWAIVSPMDYAQAGVTVAKNLAEVAELDLGFKIAKPQHFCRLSEADTSFYVKAIEKLAEHNLEMLLVVLVPSPKLDIRILVQKVAECGILAQFVEPQDFFNIAACPDSDYMQKKLKTLATQMSVKLGAEPWHVDLPFNDAMLIAIDYNADTGILGLISSTNENLTRYFSTNEKLTRYFSTTSTIQHRPTWTIIWTEIEKCLDVYRACNNEALPNRIFFYRNGVASQELSEVRNDELIHIKESLFNYYNNCQGLPKFVYTVVTAGNSAHNCTRIFEHNYDPEGKFLPTNPPVGTVVDTDITFHGQQDFYLVGTESSAPVHYNMLFNSTGLRLWEMEGLTYKFCSLYYGDSGSKRLGAPAPVEYAHALVREYGNAAAGIGIQGQVHDDLCDKLHFL